MSDKSYQTSPDAEVRDAHRALLLAEEERRRSPNDPKVLDAVAACHASAGDFDKAIELQTEAVNLCVDETKSSLLLSRLQLYRNQQPYLEHTSHVR
ncbi:MAG: hypothetical protein R3E01_13170 [Pirellulaceae bacterium]|nr:hypothetical protein [Planctomycetales bacterium]